MNTGSAFDYLGEYPVMKKNHLIISGSIMLILGPVFGLLLCIELLKLNFDRFVESDAAVPIALVATTIDQCNLSYIAGVVIGLLGGTILIVGLFRKPPTKP